MDFQLEEQLLVNMFLAQRRMTHLLHQQSRVAAATFQSSLQSFSSMKDRGNSVESKYFFVEQQREQLKKIIIKNIKNK